MSFEKKFAEKILKAQKQDKYVEILKKRNYFSIENEFLCYKGLLYVPDSDNLRLDVLKSVHDSSSFEHFGYHKTFELVNRYYWWPGLGKFVKDYVSSCHICSRGKDSHEKAYTFLQPLQIPSASWTSISWDFITELPKSAKGNDRILTIVDRFSKEAHFIPCSSNLTAETLANLFLANVYRIHGLPSEIISDRDTLFTSKFWKAFTELLGMKPRMSTAFHPQTEGQSERVNAIIKQYLRMNCDYLQTDWEEHLSLAEVAYNNSLHSSTGSSPWFATKGFHPRVVSSFEPSPKTSIPIKAQDFADKINKLHQELIENIKKPQQTQRDYYDEKKQEGPSYKKGQKVWLSSKNLKTLRPSKKLSERFLGPFPIAKVLSRQAIRLTLPPSMKCHPVFHTSLIRPITESSIPNRHQPPPPPIIVEDENKYEVEKILDSRRYRRKLQYLIRWKGYESDEDSWEPVENLKKVKRSIEEFHRQNPSATG